MYVYSDGEKIGKAVFLAKGNYLQESLALLLLCAA